MYHVGQVWGLVSRRLTPCLATSFLNWRQRGEKVYLGKQKPEKRLWVGEKEDITNDFIAVSFEYFEQNTIREIGSSDGSKNLFINIKNDKASLEKVIKNLSKRVASLKL
jgi:hypothetical protein